MEQLWSRAVEVALLLHGRGSHSGTWSPAGANLHLAQGKGGRGPRGPKPSQPLSAGAFADELDRILDEFGDDEDPFQAGGAGAGIGAGIKARVAARVTARVGRPVAYCVRPPIVIAPALPLTSPSPSHASSRWPRPPASRLLVSKWQHSCLGRRFRDPNLA